MKKVFGFVGGFIAWIALATGITLGAYLGTEAGEAIVDKIKSKKGGDPDGKMYEKTEVVE